MEVIGRLPTIPEYYRLYINRSVDLLDSPKQCCPFHKENKPSFYYSAEKGKWRCFGGCKCGGDVIDLHKKNFGLASRKEAEESLQARHKIPQKKALVTLDLMATSVNEEKVSFEEVYQKALILANCPERWLELDYVMSKTPVEELDLRELLQKWETDYGT